MPYITQTQRDRLDTKFNELIELLKVTPVEQQDGELNYVVTKMLKQLYPQRYYHFNRAMGVLNCIAFEFYRTSIAGYEETKRRDNGDVK